VSDRVTIEQGSKQELAVKLFEARNALASRNRQVADLLAEVARVKSQLLQVETDAVFADNELVRDSVGLSGVDQFDKDEAGLWGYQPQVEPLEEGS
jgi:hypothetical protein